MQAYTLKKELEGQPVAPETQAAREALEVSLELIMHKARAEFERRKRCECAQTAADRPGLPTPEMAGA